MTFAVRFPFYFDVPAGSGPTFWTFTTSQAAYSGTSAPTQANMSDGAWASAATVYGSATAVSTPSCTADFGADVTLSSIRIACIISSYGGWGPTYTNNAVLEYATEASPSTWVNLGTVSGVTDGATLTWTTGLPVTCRYLRIKHPSTWLGLGDFWFT